MIQDSPLGKKTAYADQYDADLLFRIPRQRQRGHLGLKAAAPLPFGGCDIWNAYELSWLNPQGKPVVAIGTLIIPCDSPNLVESKSLKLYFNAFNNTRFENTAEVQARIVADLSQCIGSPVEVVLHTPMQFTATQAAGATISLPFSDLSAAKHLDALDITVTDDTPNPEILQADGDRPLVNETLYSDLLRSNCPVTDQPDWATVIIEYRGHPIDHAGLLRYIVSLRNHQAFHEHCVEQIFLALQRRCRPEMLSVYARYTRRGGIDINPYRTTKVNARPSNARLPRQ